MYKIIKKSVSGKRNKNFHITLKLFVSFKTLFLITIFFKMIFIPTVLAWQSEELSYEEDTEILMHDIRDIVNEHRVAKDATLKPDRITLGILHATISVPDDFRTIQNAIDAAIDEDIIEVGSGIYNENLDINGKKITLKGEDNGLIRVSTQL